MPLVLVALVIGCDTTDEATVDGRFAGDATTAVDVPEDAGPTRLPATVAWTISGAQSGSFTSTDGAYANYVRCGTDPDGTLHVDAHLSSWRRNALAMAFPRYTGPGAYSFTYARGASNAWITVDLEDEYR